MSNSLIMAIAGSLHQNIPTGGGSITVIGNTSAHTTSSQTQIALPAGCTAGNWVVISDCRASTCTVTPPTGATALLSAFQLGTSAALADVWTYQLTSTDITNGYVSFAASQNACWYTLTAISGANAVNPVDVTGTAAVANPNVTSPINCPANSVTTTGANRLVLAFAFVSPTVAKTVTWTNPSGWTLQAETTVSWAQQLAVFSATQATAGATPNALIGASTSGANLRGAGIQIALTA